MGDEGMADERRRDQVNEVSGPTAPAADCHHPAERDAFRLDGEPRSRSRDSPCEDEGSDGYGRHDAP